METNYVELMAAWQAGKKSLEEIAFEASKLTPAVKREDPDGEIWYDGEVKNSAMALEAFYPHDMIVDFLTELENY